MIIAPLSEPSVEMKVQVQLENCFAVRGRFELYGEIHLRDVLAIGADISARIASFNYVAV